MKTPAEIAYEAAIAAIGVHERMLESLRARTGSVIAAASISASFLGSAALRMPEPSCLTLLLAWCGVLAFVGCLILAGLVLLPRRDHWPLEPSPELILQALGETSGPSAESALANVATATEQQAEELKSKMAPLWTQLRWSVILLGAQIVLWLTAVGLESR